MKNILNSILCNSRLQKIYCFLCNPFSAYIIQIQVLSLTRYIFKTLQKLEDSGPESETIFSKIFTYYVLSILRQFLTPVTATLLKKANFIQQQVQKRICSPFQDRAKIGPFFDFLLNFSIFLLGIFSIASQLSCETMFKISSNDWSFLRFSSAFFNLFT